MIARILVFTLGVAIVAVASYMIYWAANVERWVSPQLAAGIVLLVIGFAVMGFANYLRRSGRYTTVVQSPATTTEREVVREPGYRRIE